MCIRDSNYNNLTFFLGRAGDTLDFVVLRDGEKVRLDGVEMPLQARTDEEGKTTYLRGISVGREIIPATLGSKLLYSCLLYTSSFPGKRCIPPRPAEHRRSPP